jgi:hypothetical protein
MAHDPYERDGNAGFDELVGAVFAALAAAAIVGTFCLIRKPLLWLVVFAILSCLVADNYHTRTGDNMGGLLVIGWMSLGIVGICADGFYRIVQHLRAARHGRRRCTGDTYAPPKRQGHLRVF